MTKYKYGNPEAPMVLIQPVGDKEEKTKNPVMATVGDCIQEAHAWLQQCGIRSTLEWNPGNHFRDPGLRTAKAFAWVMKKS